ncbi:MAG: ABC transporter permease, partial [Pseudomonadota bacterium]
MLAYCIKKLLQLVVTTIGVVTLVFFAMRLIPGDAASAMAGDTLSGASLERLREQMGLNDPLHVQFWDFVSGLMVLDLGRTMTTNLPVSDLIKSAAPITLLIAVTTIVLAIAMAIPLGTMAAFMAHKGQKTLDNLLTGLAMVIDLMPSFWTALVFLLIFSLSFGWFPASGALDWDDPYSLLLRLALPILVLSLSQVAILARMTRTAVLEVLSEDYVRTARAMGWSELRVLFRHALK